MLERIGVSVRSLVEYVHTSGSIDVGFRTTSTMHEGTKAHQAIQRQYGERDQKEVYVQAEIPCGDLLFVVDGRCDGLLDDGQGGKIIEEIKSTRRDISAMTEEDSLPVHWAQAYMYAYMYSLEQGVEEMKVRLTYVELESGVQKCFERVVTMSTLVPYVNDMVERYAPYARMLVQNRTARNDSIAQLIFPFAEYRQGQKKLVASVFKTIDEGRKLFAKAPTGIGKTISTLFPTIKAMGMGKIEHFFYATARTITRTAAEDALGRMETQGLQLRTVTITAKDKICFLEETNCRKELCPYADGYYDRINEAVLDLLQHETVIRRDVVEQYARKHCVCPFELSLDVAYGADGMICDYNYVFDPQVSLKRLSGERKRDTVLLLDESHNLIDRAREMYSAALMKRDFLELERMFKGVQAEVHAAAKGINKWFIEHRKGIVSDGKEWTVSKERPEDLLQVLEMFAAVAEWELAAGGGMGTTESESVSMERAKLLEVYFAVTACIRISKLYDESYICYTELLRNDVQLKLLCVHPANLLRQMGKGFRGHVFFSATLSPLSYFMDMLGADEADYSITLASPFQKEQWDVSIVPLSTRYTDREMTKDRLAAKLQQLVQQRAGNYLFFFPSYAYMNVVYEAFVPTVDTSCVHTMLQAPDLTEEEREQFLAAYVHNSERSLVGFAVMGGIFSEGIDLVGDRLTGVAVIGTGMPKLGLELNLMKQYFDEQGLSGFDYAYVYPGMNKVLQAGGRLIRSEQDQGVLVLIDDRYLQPRIQRLLPEEWVDG